MLGDSSELQVERILGQFFSDQPLKRPGALTLDTGVTLSYIF